MRRGVTIWFTGLSGAGKTTLAQRLPSSSMRAAMPSRRSTATWCASTSARDWDSPRRDRDENIRRIAWVSALATRHGASVVVSAISPYRNLRREARELIGDFVEAYVQCPLETLIERDPKGLYAKALAGEIENFTGISDPYEEPEQAEIVVHTDRETVNESLNRILSQLDELGRLGPVIAAGRRVVGGDAVRAVAAPETA